MRLLVSSSTVLLFTLVWGALGDNKVPLGSGPKEIAEAIVDASKGCEGIIESVRTLTGPLSAAKDDASSTVVCPVGFVVTNCRCSIGECDGVRVPNLRICRAYASYLRKRVQAKAICTKFRSGSVDFILTRTPAGTTYNVPSRWNSHTCPGDYQLLTCNTHTYWYRRPTYGLATKSQSKCFFDCGTTTSACILDTICFKRINALPEVSLTSDRRVIRGPLSEAKDDSPSRAQCPSGFTVASCRCSIPQCDGVIMGSTSCTAYASYLKRKVQAVATCVQYARNSVTISRVKRPTSGFSTGRLSYTCPGSTSLLSCNTHTAWYKKGLSGLADINGKTCSVDCAQTSSGRGCILSAQCLRKLK